MFHLFSIMAGHSRSKNGVALLAYVPAIHVFGASECCKNVNAKGEQSDAVL